MAATHHQRRLPVGAEPLPGGGVHFRVWAPGRDAVEVVLERDGATSAEHGAHLLDREESGYHSGVVADARAGSRYRIRLDRDGEGYPDPASRFQPDGPHGASMVVDPAAYGWSDAGWGGVSLRGQVIYEMHVGTFTPEGSWDAARAHLRALAELGVTTLEILPVADFPGRFGWGYDGVNLFAPTRLYGKPDDFRRFVDAAHADGLGVILDVVYNHLGPDGNYLRPFSPRYFSERHVTEWGDALNFDAEQSAPVREFFLANVRHWIAEYHLDGLRLDATQSIFDDTRPHILSEITSAVRSAAAGRDTIVVGENEPQDARLLRPVSAGGCGIDALWNDDFHHSARVAATGITEAYYSPYRGTAQELVSAVQRGFLYQGQNYPWQQKRRGTLARLEPASLVTYLQNHDQIANALAGLRLHQLTSPGRHRALTALLLLAPQTPMLFQGQEFAASSPFLYFADHVPELAQLVEQGRAKFLAQFPTLAEPAARERLPAPHDPSTFERCKLDHTERERHAQVVTLHRDLLALRRGERAFAAQRDGVVQGAVLGPAAFVLRFVPDAHDPAEERLLLLNLGAGGPLLPPAEPLLAPPADTRWVVRWSSHDPRYGGLVAAPPEEENGCWTLAPEGAVVLAPEAVSDRRHRADRRTGQDRRQRGKYGVP